MSALSREGRAVVVLAVVSPKSRCMFGRLQFAIIHDTPTVCWLAWFCEGLPGWCKLWPSTRNRFAEIFNVILNRSTLEEMGFTLAVARTGEATDMSIDGEHPGIQQKSK